MWERIAQKALFVEVTSTLTHTPRFLRARSRWWVAYTLVNNPDLVRYRRYDPYLTADPSAVYRMIKDREHKVQMEGAGAGGKFKFGTAYTRPVSAKVNPKRTNK